jgi:methylated-DNA-[protein]-cysteine S-methyltransferase
MSQRAYTVMDSPVGPLTLVAADGVLTGLYMDRQRYRPEEHTFGERDPALFGAAIGQLEEYFVGRRTVFDLPLALTGTAFQRRVWNAVAAIPYGAVTTYAALADAIGSPRAWRAVGAANGRNPLPIVVPCHRVVGVSGALTGYGGGLELKRALLALEAGRGPD